MKKNGILQVDYTNVLRERGLPRDQAILDANSVRLRPILMTTVMLVAAMVPMAVGEGPGAASRAGMAKVILGGQLLSLLLTLLLTPVAYSLWDDLTTIVRRWGTRLGWIVDHEDEATDAPWLPDGHRWRRDRHSPQPVRCLWQRVLGTLQCPRDLCSSPRVLPMKTGLIYCCTLFVCFMSGVAQAAELDLSPLNIPGLIHTPVGVTRKGRPFPR